MSRPIPLLLCLALCACLGTAGAAPLADRHAAQGLDCPVCHKESRKAPPAKAQCLACHGSYDKVAARTAKKDINPHATHMGQIECSSCHNGHKPGALPCVECHGDAFNKELPVP